MQKLGKNNEQSLRYLKTDGPTNGPRDEQGRLLSTPSGKPRVQNWEDPYCCFEEKRPKRSENTFFGHLITYNQELGFLSEKQSSSYSVPYCTLQS